VDHYIIFSFVISEKGADSPLLRRADSSGSASPPGRLFDFPEAIRVILISVHLTCSLTISETFQSLPFQAPQTRTTPVGPQGRPANRDSATESELPSRIAAASPGPAWQCPTVDSASHGVSHCTALRTPAAARQVVPCQSDRTTARLTESA
jgi:hypothetical protein